MLGSEKEYFAKKFALEHYQNPTSSVTIEDVVICESPKRILITRNHSLSSFQAVIIIFFFAVVLGSIAIVFYIQGAWMILPFAGLELLAVAAGFYACIRHNNDYELVEIDDTKIHVKRYIAKREQNFSFQTYWTKVLLEITEGWYPSKLWMKSKGKQVELGGWLTDAERRQLAHRLKNLI